MTIELDKAGLVSLVIGTTPFTHELHEQLSRMGLGVYVGGMADRWTWHEYALSKLSEEELFIIYRSVRNSE